MDQLSNLLNKLSLNPDKKEVLAQIKVTLPSLPPNDLEGILKLLSLEPLLDCLKSSSDDIELACEILTTILSSLPTDYVLNKFEKALNDGLLQPSSFVKRLVLEQVLNGATVPEAFIKFLSDSDVLVRIVSLHIDSDLSVVKYAQQILIKLATFEESSSLLFSPMVLQCFHEVMGENDTIKYRILEVVVSISKQSANLLEKCVAANHFTKLLLDVDSSDILIQLNAIEMLSDLAMVSHGLQYLENMGVVRKLEIMLDKTNDDVQGRFLLPGLFKFFGHVGHLHPHEICNRYKTFISKVYEAVDANSLPGLTIVAIQTIAIIGSTANGKVALNNIGNPTVEVMKCIGHKIQDSSMEVKIATLNAVESLMNIKKEDRTPAIEEILKNWFDNLTKNTMKLFMDMSKHPFTEVRCAVLGVYKALADQPWSQRYMNDHPGFIEYLLDRSTESDKDGKYSKFQVIQALANSSTVATEFGNIVLLRLRQYVNEGPYFVQVESAVTFDGDGN